MKIRKGTRFGSWKVLDSDPYYYEHHKNPEQYLKCQDVVNNKIQLVKKYHLISGLSTGSRESIKQRIELGIKRRPGGHSARVKNKHLPMYVHPWQDTSGKHKKYRYLKKKDGRVVTHKYFKTLKEAKQYAESL